MAEVKKLCARFSHCKDFTLRVHPGVLNLAHSQTQKATLKVVILTERRNAETAEEAFQGCPLLNKI